MMGGNRHKKDAEARRREDTYDTPERSIGYVDWLLAKILLMVGLVGRLI